MWFQLIGQLVGAAAQPVQVPTYAPPPPQDDTLTWVLIGGGLLAAGYLAYSVLSD